MNEAPITADMVLEVTPVRRAKAERIAAYANLRARGLLQPDAAREMDIQMVTAQRYERFIKQLRRQLGLPELSGPQPVGAGVLLSERGDQGRHQRHHVNQGVTKPGCALCEGGTS